MRYMVELRSYSEDGDDYSEDHYAFETRGRVYKVCKAKQRSSTFSTRLSRPRLRSN